jgi:NADH-quinone oxidoreductase subunit G
MAEKPAPTIVPAPRTEAAPAPAARKMVRFKLNGRELEVPAGTTVIRAAHDAGVPVPYFCYHPGLSPEGNCRMCLVEASNSRKPIPACTTPVAEGLEIQTESPAARAARADVLEFMLVNHPLDCPICDKSGECLLQDNAYGHGKDRSRMIEKKELKPTKELGAGIHLWGNRCIVCTRCVRFCSEISGTGELTIVERSDHSVVDVFPAYPLQNPLAGNVVDICPVGALISKEFLYEARVWNQGRTDSICTSCARGCNIRVESLSNKIKRLVPRHNPAVNDYWMCDHGRHDFHYVLGPKRWLRYRLGPSSAPSGAARFLHDALQGVAARHGPQAIGGLASAFMTLETLYLLRRLFEAFEVPLENLAARARPGGEAQVFKSGFKISADRNPNRAGAALLLGKEAFGERRDALLHRLREGRLRALLIFSDIPHFPIEEEVLSLLGGLELAVVFLLEADPRLPPSAALLPASAFSEREGAVVNEDGRVQLLRRATQLPRAIIPEHDVLQDALLATGKRRRRVPPAALFEELAEVAPEFLGMTHASIGLQGRPVAGGRP